MNRSIIITSALAVVMSAGLSGCGSEADAADLYGMPTAVSQQKNETSAYGSETSETTAAVSESMLFGEDTQTESLVTENDPTEMFFTETVTGFFDDTETGETTEITPAPYIQPETSSETQTSPEQTAASPTTAASETTTTVQTTTAPPTTTTAQTTTTVQTTTTAQTTTTTAAPKRSSAAMTLSYGGSVLKIGDNADNFVKSTSPSFMESAPSCYGNGENINYYYDSFTIFVWNENENYMTYGIDIFGVGVPTAEGISIGSGVDELTTVYGEDYAVQGPDYIYTYGDMNMRFTVNNGKVSYISLNKDI